MRSHHGMTIIEMLISLSIIAILLTVVAPSVQSILKSNKVTADVNNLSALARQARFTAINERADVVLCPTTNYSSCSGSWSNAKMVFIDNNGNGNRDTDERLIASADPLSQSNRISGVSGSLMFYDNGGIDKNAEIVICPSGGDAKSASAILMSMYGRITTASDSNKDGIKENASGSNISCS